MDDANNSDKLDLILKTMGEFKAALEHVVGSQKATEDLIGGLGERVGGL